MKILIYIIASLSPSTLLAQQQFITQGRIEFERKTNQHAFMDESSIWDDMAKKNLPKFVTFYYDLTFKGDRTIFKVGRDPDTKQNKYWGIFDSENTILTKLDSNTSITQRSIWGDLYLVADSLRHVEWKITPEIRKIAGFDCRKAVGKVMDSIVVIAFYTDEILTNGGPESFNGLPGMILGLAIPRLHTTWYATKLQLIEVTDKDLVSPRKGKKMTGTDYRSHVQTIMKDWGNDGAKRQFQFLL
ncbi:GLPGLI family protein [Niastella caeni]|uniref:GLPGLI family protein n=1 Tax=Niastella caeni TaxID=2569763 RepID=A0A4S8HRD0_9BACT|nr:GLPGLI family protein [Niastella caeni]THU37983.1 GLPGLI family protein [Niastella caeni]